ncbi:hypothetical protein RF11_11424 [Thelohanellus kitauei]|uniref:Uncharacterized protein n=1 Tax=Thelohanellus kitauei TaxID=669202 RepID=A0A0C2MA97_THEKT|nr:hypothetical protein RF11_11424 [Thelohanellus kitauei]
MNLSNQKTETSISEKENDVLQDSEQEDNVCHCVEIPERPVSTLRVPMPTLTVVGEMFRICFLGLAHSQTFDEFTDDDSLFIEESMDDDDDSGYYEESNGDDDDMIYEDPVDNNDDSEDNQESINYKDYCHYFGDFDDLHL